MQTTRPDDPRPRSRPLLSAAIRSPEGQAVGFRRGRRLYHIDGEFWFEIGDEDPRTHSRPLIESSGRVLFYLTDSGQIVGPHGELMATLSTSRAMLFIIAALLVVCALSVTMWLLMQQTGA